MDYMDDDRQTIILEGVYNGVAGKIDELHREVSKELKYSSQQQASAYDSIISNIKDSLEAILAEFRFLAEQSSTIYDVERGARIEMQAAVIKSVNDELARRMEGMGEIIAKGFQKTADELSARLDEKIAALKGELSSLSSASQKTEETEGAQEVKSLQIDYDLIAEKVAEKLSAAGKEEKTEGAPAAAAAMVGDDAIDYDVLAEKIATILPEVDYDTIAERVSSAVPQADENTLADRIAAVLPQADENAIADRVAEMIPPVDYDFIAERVAQVLEGEFDLTLDEKGIERIASAVCESLDYAQIAEQVARILKETAQDAVVFVPREQVAASPAPSEASEEKSEEESKESDELAVAAQKPASRPKTRTKKAPARVQEEEDDDEEDEDGEGDEQVLSIAPDSQLELITRYKRSFTAKIVQASDEVKGYYGEIRNAFLACNKVHSRVSWSNDRFSLGGETLAKVAISGKTLCLYLALDCDEFQQSVYHHRNMGERKAYEKTPMLLKIRSALALKRALSLVELILERNGAEYGDGQEPEDFAKTHPYKSDELLIKEGYIKTALVVKSKLDF